MGNENLMLPLGEKPMQPAPKGPNMNRRRFLQTNMLIAAVIGTGSAVHLLTGSASAKSSGNFAVTKTEAEWRKILTPNRYAILREEATERPFTSPLLTEKRPGIFHCAGCDLAAYDNKTKFKSGTGWPSFYEALPNSVGTRTDKSFFMVRTEVHCSRCGGHYGHIFDDGPPPTGKRHCINGLSLKFKPANA